MALHVLFCFEVTPKSTPKETNPRILKHQAIVAPIMSLTLLLMLATIERQWLSWIQHTHTYLMWSETQEGISQAISSTYPN